MADGAPAAGSSGDPDGPSPHSVDGSVYARAERFLPWHASTLLHHASAVPHWIASSDRFWYRVTTRDGAMFMLVDAETGDRRPAFDHARLAHALSAATGKTCCAETLPFDEITFVDGGQTLEFGIGDRRWRCDLESYTCGASPSADLAGELHSPDGSRTAFVRDHNLWVRDLNTGQEKALTADGQPDRTYATALPSPLRAAGIATTGDQIAERCPAAIWSPDSRKLLSHCMDSRGAGTFTLVQSVPPGQTVRPDSYTFVYPLPGDESVPAAHLLLFDVDAGTATPVRMAPVPVLHYGTPLQREPGQMAGKAAWWHADGSRCYVLRRERGYLGLALCEIDANTGTARWLVEETDDTPVDPHLTVDGGPNVRVIYDGDYVLWFSQRDNWGHLYLYHADGTLIRQLTSGTWAVADVLHVDEKRRRVYFTAVGREPCRDPYAHLLYRVSLDGGEPELLTPESGSHIVSVSPTGRFFVSTWSAIDTPPITVLRRTDGSLITDLEKADLSDLTAMGWTFPERFTAKSRDGVTDVYGTLIRPSTFDPDHRYPVVDAIYGGPQVNQAPVSFAETVGGRHGFWHAQAIAELGFVVVMIDGLGMPYRSKDFRDVAYRNLADAGIIDHIHVLRALAENRPYLNIDRVGIYGHSAGGYASCRAILAYPDFYKVCVSSAGNHDHRLDKAWWVERYMGLPTGEHYRDQANQSLAHRLVGKLLLMHGEMDENVHVSSTLAMVDALVKADRDFDLLILPGETHAMENNPHVIRRRWDYFLRHLADLEPPPYRVTGAGEAFPGSR